MKNGVFKITLVLITLTIFTQIQLPAVNEKASILQNQPTIKYVDSAFWTRLSDIRIKKNLAYCAFGNGLIILDVTKRESPKLVSKLYLGGGKGIELRDNTVFLAAQDQGLQIVDVSNPKNPKTISRVSTPGQVNKVYLQDFYSYLAVHY